MEQELPELMVLKSIMARAKRFMLPKTVRKLILVVLFLLIFDALVSFLGASYLSENIGTFIGKSGTVIFSDFLFLEGSITLAIGIFIAVAVEWEKTKPLSEPSKEIDPNTEETPRKWMNIGVLMIVVGAVLIGLSITVGTLLH